MKTNIKWFNKRRKTRRKEAQQNKEYKTFENTQQKKHYTIDNIKNEAKDNEFGYIKNTIMSNTTITDIRSC